MRALLPFVEELFSSESIERGGVFDVGAVEKLIDKVRRGRAIGQKDNMALAFILSAQLVQEQFISRYRKWKYDDADLKIGT